MPIRRVAAALLALPMLAATVPAGPAWQPARGHRQIALWPAAPPDPMPTRVTGPEFTTTNPKERVGGGGVTAVQAVTRPTLTVYRPKGPNTGAAVVVYPGGGFWILAIDLEGTDVCDWLTANGITCVLVKYRVPGDDETQASRTGPYPKSPVALEDAQRAIALTRYHATDWGIDPHRIGVVGFSAGGYLVAATSTIARIYKPVDDADRVSTRPDFAMALYPGHLWTDESRFRLDAGVPLNAHTPPTFIVQNEDDPVDSVNNSLVYYRALQQAGVPAELHLFAKGGHAFGLRHDPTKPATDWPILAMAWMRGIGVLASPASEAAGPAR